MTAAPVWLPGKLQQLLLDACLLDDERALRAYAEWRSLVDFDRLDAGSYRMLPLLWKRMSALGIDDSLREKLKGVYRKTWYFNGLAIPKAARVLELLAASGVPAMVFKGVALTLGHYRDLGARPMGDIDVAVPRALARKAVEILVEHGWIPEITPLTGARVAGSSAVSRWTVGPRPAGDFDDDYFDARHAHGFTRGSDAQLDLHWFLLQGNCEAGVDDSVWADARPLVVAGVSALTLSPEDHLLLLLAHGARWNPIPPVRWVADAVTLIRAEPQLSWNTFVDRARRRGLVVVARNLLSYLDERFAVVPADTIRELESAAVTQRERRDYRMRISPPGFATGLEEVLYLRSRYLEGRNAHRGAPSRRSFTAYVRHVLGAASLPHVGGYALSEIARRARN
jgi:hypothetical protein